MALALVSGARVISATSCVFQGSVWCEQHPAGWEAELRGVFRDVDLEQLVTRQFPHKLSGMAILTLQPVPGPRGPSDGGRRGGCSVREGVVSQSLLGCRRADRWDWQQHPRVGGAALLAYDQLALDFSLSAAGLTLATPEQPGTAVLADSQGRCFPCATGIRGRP